MRNILMLITSARVKIQLYLQERYNWTVFEGESHGTNKNS